MNTDVSKTNKLRQLTNSNVTYEWMPGSLNDLDISVLNAEQVGLLACGTRNRFYGVRAEEGLRIWVATHETTFAELAWINNGSTWSWQRSWTGFNGHATPSCYTWSPRRGVVTYVSFVDLSNQAIWYWYALRCSSSADHSLLTHCAG